MTPAAMSDDKPQSVYTPLQESPLLFEGLTWREFKAVEQLLDRPGYRLSFLDGVLEIRRMPGEAHETVKERLGALLELYLLMAGFDFTPTGSMTLESESGAVKREADKSYKKLHPQGDGVFGHGESGMGHGKKLPMPYALCPMPHATGRLSLSTHVRAKVTTGSIPGGAFRAASRREGMEFPVAFNKLAPSRVRPDLAIEVVFTSGGINKLEAYKRLLIPEVWFWEDGVLFVYHLRYEGDGLHYERVSSSEEVKGIDLDLLLRCINMVNHVDAIKTFQQALSTYSDRYH